MITERARQLFIDRQLAEDTLHFFIDREARAAVEHERLTALRMEASRVLNKFEDLLLAIPEEERFE